MTLAHSFKRPASYSPMSDVDRAGTSRSATPIDLRDLVRRPAAPPPPAPNAFARPHPLAASLQAGAPYPSAAAAPAYQEARAVPVPSFDTRPKADVALDILSDLAVIVPALMERNRVLQAELGLQREQADAELNAVNNRADALHAIAETLKSQLARMEAELAAAGERALMAEKEVQRLAGSTEDAHRAAAQAECLASLFEEKVIGAFGAGTTGHALLEEFRAI